MSDFFSKLDNIGSLEAEFTGPDYDYYKKIKSPGELGMTSKGGVSELASDIAGLVDYVEVIVSGGGKASKVGEPMGGKFLLKTAGQCKDYKTGKLVSRDMYINNQPTSKIPIISNVSGMSFPEFRGLVPGIIEDVYDINPIKIFRAFMEGNEPICAEVSLPTISPNNIKGNKSGYVPIVELQDLVDSGKIPSNVLTSEMKNAIKSGEKEGFVNMWDIVNGEYNDNFTMVKKLDTMSNVYIVSLGLVIMYIIYKLMKK